MPFFVFLGRDNAGLDHFPIEVISFTSSFTNTSKYGVTAVAFGNVVDKLHDDHGLTYASTTESTNFTTLGERTDQVDHLDTCLKNLGGRILVNQGWSLAVNRITLRCLRCRLVIYWISSYVENTAKNFFTNWNSDWSTCVYDIHATLKTIRGGHCNATNPAIAKVTLHFTDQTGSFPEHVVVDLERVVNFRQFACCGEIYVHHWTDDLDDFADIAHGGRLVVENC